MPSKYVNRFLIGIIESPLHPLVGPRLAVIRVVGRKTGRTYATPINIDREGDVWEVTSLRSRTWWRNLRDAHQAKLTLTGRVYMVEGSVVEEGEAVKAGLAAYFERHPRECRYYGVGMGADGRALDEDVRRVADERVIIRLTPT